MQLFDILVKPILFLSICFLLLITPLFAQEPSVENGEVAVKSKLFIEAEESISTGNVELGIKQLKNCISAGEKIPEANALLFSVYASKSADISKGRPISQLSLEELDLLEKNYIEILNLKSARDDDWFRCLELLLFRKKNNDMALIAQDYLIKLYNQPNKKFNNAWMTIFIALENEYNVVELIIFKYQVLKIQKTNIVHLGETEEKLINEKLINTKLENMAKTIKSQLKYFFGQIDVAIALGELSRAEKLLAQVEYFDPEQYLIPKIKNRLKLVAKIQVKLKLARNALHNKKFALATKYCEAVFKLDAKNPFAQNILKEIASMKAIPVKRISSKNRFKLKLRMLTSQLKKAEKDQDLLNIRRILRELIFSFGSFEYSAKLKKIDNEIRESRIKAEARFEIAKKLFSNNHWGELYFFLNRNPGLMSSIKRLITIWEMRLMTNYHLKKKDVAEIKEAAERIISKDKNSFYANYVIMKLYLANNKYDKARKFYNIANEVKPNYSGLRSPRWLLWAHGEGKPWAISLTIAFFLLLIKLIKPAFALFESTYWFRTRMIGLLFPSLALRSLEKCFGSVVGDKQRVELFHKLLKYSIRLKDIKKSLRYAEMILEISPDDVDALEILAQEYLTKPNVDAIKLKVIVLYAMNNKEDVELQSKVGLLIKNSAIVTLDQIDFLNNYVERIQDDEAMLELIGKSFLALSVANIPDSAIRLLEIAWERTNSDELWWSLWRLLMQTGKFDKAQSMLEVALENGKPIEVDKLFNIFEQEVMGEILSIKSMLGVMDQTKILESLAVIPAMKYINESMADELTVLLHNLTIEEDNDVKFSAQKAVDHIKFQLKRSQAAHDKMMLLQDINKEDIVSDEVNPVVEVQQECDSAGSVETKELADLEDFENFEDVTNQGDKPEFEALEELVKPEEPEKLAGVAETNQEQIKVETISNLFADLEEFDADVSHIDDEDTVVKSDLFDDL